MITSILRGTRSDNLAFVTREEDKINPLGIEYKGISKVAKLEIKEELNWNKWIQGNQCHGGYKQTREMVRCKSNENEGIK
jgi:hypothetical protein